MQTPDKYKRMSTENPQPAEPFAFTEREKLWERISDDRVRALLNDDQTTVHKVEVDNNSYGEFLFVTVSRSEEGRQQVLTLYGYGYHDYRERWYTHEWSWFRANPFPQTLEQRLTKEEAAELMRTRREEIAHYVEQNTQTARGKLFELLAELTDDDGAISEMEDLGGLWHTLTDRLE
ncbi:MAG: hypothetical protein K8J31_32060 [Anaerolineae bacterium]|nr:hypothetical protein [Anaerolineae bacterium]